MAVDFKAQLRRQLQYLETSSRFFDQGLADEAIRIALPLRVLFHDTGRQTSLLTHLGAASVKVRSTVMEVAPGAIFYDGIALTKFGSSGTSIGPHFGDGPVRRLIPRDEWWNQTVCVDNRVAITREDIVLAAANKDGGAHVDKKVPPAYESLQRGIWTLQTGTMQLPIRNHHFIFLRQAAYEVLNSPEIVGLTI